MNFQFGFFGLLRDSSMVVHCFSSKNLCWLL